MHWKTAFEIIAGPSKHMVQLMQQLQSMVGVEQNPRTAVRMVAALEASVLKGFKENTWDDATDNRMGKDSNFKITKTGQDKVDVVVGLVPATRWDPSEPKEEVTDVTWPDVVECIDVFDYDFEKLLRPFISGLPRLLKIRSDKGLTRHFLMFLTKNQRMVNVWLRDLLARELRVIFRSDIEELDIYLVDVVERDELVEWGISVNSVDLEWKTTPISSSVHKVSFKGKQLLVTCKFVVKTELTDWKNMEVDEYDDRDYDDDRDQYDDYDY